MQEPNTQLVRAYMRAINDDDMERAIAMCDVAFEMTESFILPGAANVSGHDGLKRYVRGWKRNWSEWDWREEELLDLPPQHVLLVATLWLRGLRSGAAVERRWAYVFTIGDGKLLRQDGYDDREQALQALGCEHGRDTDR